MNKVILSGRLTADPDISFTAGQQPVTVARYKLAVDRKYKKNGERSTDFIGCVAFGKNGEFARSYLHKGIKIMVEGHIQTGSYKNKEGDTVYTTDVVVDGHEFCESKKSGGNSAPGGFGGGFAADQNAYPAFPASDTSFAELEEDDSDLPF